LSEVVRAVRIAMNVHSGQVDKNGEPYILHPLRVMASCGELGEDYACAAVLHDVLEDSELEPIDLSHSYEFNAAVVGAVDALTRRDGERYSDFIRRCAKNKIARVVKVSDIRDNMRPSCDPSATTRRQRYENALVILLNEDP